jgi:hypothetical protein
MMFYPKILSVYGEGDRKAVEGGAQLFNIAYFDRPPSVSASHCHLPVNGEDFK